MKLVCKRLNDILAKDYGRGKNQEKKRISQQYGIFLNSHRECDKTVWSKKINGDREFAPMEKKWIYEYVTTVLKENISIEDLFKREEIEETNRENKRGEYYDSEFSKRVRIAIEWLKHRGITSEVAICEGKGKLHYNTLKKYRNGEVNPQKITIEEVKKLSITFDITIWYFFEMDTKLAPFSKKYDQILSIILTGSEHYRLLSNAIDGINEALCNYYGIEKFTLSNLFLQRVIDLICNEVIIRQEGTIEDIEAFANDIEEYDSRKSIALANALSKGIQLKNIKYKKETGEKGEYKVENNYGINELREEERSYNEWVWRYKGEEDLYFCHIVEDTFVERLANYEDSDKYRDYLYRRRKIEEIKYSKLWDSLDSEEDYIRKKMKEEMDFD